MYQKIENVSHIVLYAFVLLDICVPFLKRFFFAIIRVGNREFWHAPLWWLTSLFVSVQNTKSAINF